MLELDTTGKFTRSEYIKVEELDKGFLVTVYVDEREKHGYYDPDLVNFATTTIDREQAKELFEYLKVKLDGKV